MLAYVPLAYLPLAYALLVVAPVPIPDAPSGGRYTQQQVKQVKHVQVSGKTFQHQRSFGIVEANFPAAIHTVGRSYQTQFSSSSITTTPVEVSVHYHANALSTQVQVVTARISTTQVVDSEVELTVHKLSGYSQQIQVSHGKVSTNDDMLMVLILLDLA